MQNKLLRLAAYAGCVSSLVIFFSAGGMTPLQDGTAWISSSAQSAAVFLVPSITVAQITSNYNGSQFGDSVTATSSAPSEPAKKVRILIVPGHQPDLGGTEFNGLHERDVVVDIADALANLLLQNPHFDVMVARTKTAWNPVLQTYFDTHALEIDTFRQSQSAQMQNHLADGSLLTPADQVYHNAAPASAALLLYGINKWANDNKYDITLHLHINDDAEHRASSAGKYGGFVVYVPDHQYSNAEASRSIGEAIATRLNAYHATSTLPQEGAGVVEDQELIATGSNNSVDGAALLIEYGYIYEPQFQRSSIRAVAVADYAYQTYLGLQDFFNDPISSTYGSISFPYDWSEVTANKNERGASIYALQAALRYLDSYPPNGKSFSDCPISGKVGPCTRSAIKAYQSAHNLETTGILGPKTRAALEKDLSTP